MMDDLYRTPDGSIDAARYAELGAVPGRLAEIVRDEAFATERWRETVTLMVRSICHTSVLKLRAVAQGDLLRAVFLASGQEQMRDLLSANLSILRASGEATESEIDQLLDETFDTCLAEANLYGKVLGFDQVTDSRPGDLA